MLAMAVNPLQLFRRVETRRGWLMWNVCRKKITKQHCFGSAYNEIYTILERYHESGGHPIFLTFLSFKEQWKLIEGILCWSPKALSWLPMV